MLATQLGTAAWTKKKKKRRLLFRAFESDLFSLRNKPYGLVVQDVD